MFAQRSIPQQLGDHCCTAAPRQYWRRPATATTATKRDVLSLIGVALGSQALPAPAAETPLTTTPAPLTTLRTSSSSRLQLEARVAEFTLPNGLHFIVLPRSEAPIVSCHVHAAVGAYVEEEGRTGLAHLLEHMAFKGTPSIGSKDWSREAPLLLAADEAFYDLRGALRDGAAADSGRVQRLEQRFKQVQAAAEELVVPNAFGALLQSAGGVGLNAATSQDSTRYFVSLPSNKLQLWFALESQRFQVPVFRSLYAEKEVVAEERRMRQENSPMGALMFDFQQQAFGNNYRRPVIGYAEDVDAMGTREVAGFFERYYHPRNLTISIVGDVTPERVQQFAETYFGGWEAPAGSQDIPLQQPEPLTSARPASLEPISTSSSSSRLIEVQSSSVAGPLVLLGFYRPSLLGRSGVALEVAADVLSAGRSSRLVQQLVMQGSALGASVSPSYPSELHAGLALVSGVPASNGSPRQLAQLLQDQLDALMESGPSPQELSRVQKESRSSLYNSLTSNSSMASLLGGYHATTGSWKVLLDELEMVDDLTVNAVRTAAQQVFPASNSFAAYVARPKAA